MERIKVFTENNYNINRITKFLYIAEAIGKYVYKGGEHRNIFIEKCFTSE